MMAFDEIDLERPDDAQLNIESAAAIARLPVDPIAFDVEILLPADDAPILIFGPPASLKTWIAIHLLDAIVTGERFLGRYVVQRRERGLYVNLDAGPKTFRNRVRRVSDAEGFDFVSMSASEFTFPLLRTLLAEYRDGFIVLDCLSSIYNPDRTKDPAFAMRQFVDDLRAVFAEFNCGGAVIDHPHRPKERGEIGDYHGSVQKEAAFRGMWSVNAEPADDTGNGSRRARITCRKLSEGQPFAPVHVVIDFGDRMAFATAEADPEGATDEVETRLVDWALTQAEPFSKNSATLAISGRNGEKRNAFDRLVLGGTFAATGKKRNGAALYEHRSKTPPTSPGLGWADLGGLGPETSPTSPGLGWADLGGLGPETSPTSPPYVVGGEVCGAVSQHEPGPAAVDDLTRRGAGPTESPSGTEIPARQPAEDIE